jgi:hypothetical protein
MPSSLLQVVNSLFQTCYNKLGTSSASTTLLTACEQTCNNLFADLLQLVRFYVCRLREQTRAEHMLIYGELCQVQMIKNLEVI